MERQREETSSGWVASLLKPGAASILAPRVGTAVCCTSKDIEGQNILLFIL